MTFMLGAFTQGLSQGAKDIYGLSDTAAQTDQRRASTEALRQETSMKGAAFQAAHDATLQAGGNVAPTPALNTTSSSSGTGGGSVGTTDVGPANAPVAPLNFATAVPQPNYMPQSQPGSPSGFAPSMNPEAGPVSAAQGQGQAGAGNNYGPQNTVNNPAPRVNMPTLGSGAVRTNPTNLGGYTSAPGAQTAASPQAVPTSPQPAPAQTGSIDPDKPLAQQLGNIDADTPLLKQWFGGGGKAAPAPATTPAAASEPVNQSPHRQRENAKAQKTAPQQTSSNIGRHLAGALNLA